MEERKTRSGIIEFACSTQVIKVLLKRSSSLGGPRTRTFYEKQLLSCFAHEAEHPKKEKITLYHTFIYSLLKPQTVSILASALAQATLHGD